LDSGVTKEIKKRGRPRKYLDNENGVENEKEGENESGSESED
jgi:hypothetical protein